MASDKPKDLMGYETLQQDALRGVIRAALEPADVTAPEDLVARYPEEMTIVLQNQFWDLAPGETGFSVTLQFGGQPKTLAVPYAAVTRFYDPSVQYLLQFTPPDPAPAPVRPVGKKAAAAAPAGDDGPKIVSLDQFRKK